MKRRKGYISLVHTLLVLTVLMAVSLQSDAAVHVRLKEVILDTDLQSSRKDSLPPVATYSLPLPDYNPFGEYAAFIEYPELTQVPSSCLEAWGLQACDIPEWPVINTSVGISRHEAGLDVSFLPLLNRDGKIWQIESYKLTITETIPTMAPGRDGTSGPSDRYTHESVLSRGRWIKIGITESGIYKLSYSKLRGMGFQNPDSVRLFGYGGAMLPEQKLQNLPDDLQEQPLWRGGDYVLFYAQGPVSMEWSGVELVHRNNPYSDAGYYFLTDRQDIPQWGETAVSGSPSAFETLPTDSIYGTAVTSFRECAVHEEDQFSWYRSGRRLFEKYDYAIGPSRIYHFDTPGMVEGNATLAVAFTSNDAAANRLSASVLDQTAGTLYIPATGSQEAAQLVEKTFAFRSAETDRIDVKLTHDRTSGASGHLDYLRINYDRLLDMKNLPFLRFRTSGNINNVSFAIRGTGSSVQVWRISDSGKADIIPSCHVHSEAGDTTITYAADFLKSDILIAVNPGASFPEPTVIGQIGNQNLHASDPVDMVIVVPQSGQLTAQAQRLAQAHREIDGLSVLVVNAGCIYNEFSSGTPDATAIRRFMKMLYDRAGNADSAPRYLLLMGSGAWDNRMHVSDFAGCRPEDYLPCYESDNSLSHTMSYVMEDYFGLLDDSEGVNLLTEKTDLGVGRLPVTTEQEARKVIDKIIAYMDGSASGKWQNEILVLGDDGDDNSHMEDADAVASLMASSYPDKRIRKMYWDAYPMEVSASYNGYPTLRARLLEKLKDGVLMVNYSGHGSMDVLSHELVMSKADALGLESAHLPFWFLASCDIAPFDQPLENFGCNLLLNPAGGAVGLVSTTRTVYSSLNRLVNRSFSKYVLAHDSNNRQYALGDALRLAKNELVTSGSGNTDMSQNKLHYVLLGDPALRLRNSRYTCVVDSFDNAPAGSAGLAAKAGGTVSVSGHIELDGMRQPDFNGTLFSTVLDSEREIECFNNLKTASYKFTYSDRDKVLSTGADSVRNGEFSFTFPVPLDINYSNESGLISLFAVSEMGQAAGTYTDFIVGGTDSGIGRDSLGPDIRMYLNSPSFQYGSKVNTMPTLVVSLSDESGLNVSGNGLGHDIMLVIDGKRTMSWVLNGYFEQEPGDWTAGTIRFRIPEPLSEGRHKLVVRAWDNMNNSNSVQLEFKVEEGLAPGVSVDVTESPAREHTKFIISHDRPMQDVRIGVQVYDSHGVLQWSSDGRDSHETGVVMLDWNLCGNGGHRLPAGLYIVRATVSDDNSTRSVQCKMVIAAP